MSFSRTQQLRDLQQIIEEISKEIMWVNDKEEEELMFDWGDKNIDQYIPKKQESYSVSGDATEIHFLGASLPSITILGFMKFICLS